MTTDMEEQTCNQDGKQLWHNTEVVNGIPLCQKHSKGKDGVAEGSDASGTLLATKDTEVHIEPPKSDLLMDYVPLALRRAPRKITKKTYNDDAEVEEDYIPKKKTKPRSNKRKSSLNVSDDGGELNAPFSVSHVSKCSPEKQKDDKETEAQLKPPSASEAGNTKTISSSTLTNLPTPCGYNKIDVNSPSLSDHELRLTLLVISGQGSKLDPSNVPSVSA